MTDLVDMIKLVSFMTWIRKENNHWKGLGWRGRIKGRRKKKDVGLRSMGPPSQTLGHKVASLPGSWPVKFTQGNWEPRRYCLLQFSPGRNILSAKTAKVSYLTWRHFLPWCPRILIPRATLPIEYCLACGRNQSLRDLTISTQSLGRESSIKSMSAGWGERIKNTVSLNKS